jgi:retron-type reverse transcriptase
MWNQLCSIENLYSAYKKASKGRRSRQDVAEFEIYLEENLFDLREELLNEGYQHGNYHSFSIHDPKKRLISAAKFRDRIVHHALVAMMEPIYEKLFYPNSYANRVGKGTHKALKYCASMLKGYKYYLFMDVKQFFPSIDHGVLKRLLREQVSDEKVLKLCDIILKSGEGVLCSEYDMVWFEGDDLFAINRPRGLPIGNMSSQFWANVYMHALDCKLADDWACEAWVRYVDDLIVFGNSKAELHEIRRKTIVFLKSLRLTIHEGSAQPTPVSQGVTFLGFRLFPAYKRLKREKLVNGYRKLLGNQKLYEKGGMSLESYQNRLRGWLNHVRFGDTWHLRNRVLNRLGINAYLNLGS